MHHGSRGFTLEKLKPGSFDYRLREISSQLSNLLVPPESWPLIKPHAYATKFIFPGVQFCAFGQAGMAV